MSTALIQSVILIEHAGPLEAVLLPDNHDGASVRSLCAFLQIDRASQITRIKKNKALAPGLTLVDVPTSDGLRALLVLRSEYTALFVATLHIGRLSPEAQANAAILQERASAAIAKAFSQPEVTTSEPIPTAPAPELLSVQAAFDHIQHSLVGLQEGFEELKEHVVGIDQRIVLLEQDRLGRRMGSGARLSAAQVGQLFMQLSLLREETGLPIEDAEKQLAAQFGIAHVIDIDASKWPALQHAILALFHR